MSDSKQQILTYTYKFTLENGKEKSFTIHLDPTTLINIKQDRLYPEWTKFKNFQCQHCTINSDQEESCPVAVNLEGVISFFSDFISFNKVNLSIETPQRSYMKSTSLQDAVSTLIGVLMPSSGCPVMGKLKPMVKNHLPFSSLQETEYRVLSMYLLAQYFRYKKGKTPDWDMKNLKTIYEDIKKLNQNVARQIARLEKNDTSINAVVVLNNFAEYVTIDLDENSLDEMEILFKDYL